MKCLITGASSGIGRDMAKYLAKLGHNVILVSSDMQKLDKVGREIEKSTTFQCDLRKEEDVDRLVELIKRERPKVVINNAGFGAFGFYDEIELDREMEMVSVNVIALHKITKACLEYMGEKEKNYILNVASSAGLMPGGPMMSTYYATKSYVKSYSLGIYKELKYLKRNISISVLCPGPVNTNFNKVAGGTFSVKALSSEYVAKYAIKKMFKEKMVIVPGLTMKLGVFFSRFTPTKLLLQILFKIQHKKNLI